MGNAILPVFQVFARHILTALLGGGGCLMTPRVTLGRAGMTLDHGPWPRLQVLSCKLHSFTIHMLTNFKRNVSASDLLRSALSPAYSALTASAILPDPPASPQNKLLRRLQEPPAPPSKHHKTASRNKYTSMEGGKFPHFTKKRSFCWALAHYETCEGSQAPAQVHGSQGPYSPQVSTVDYPKMLKFPQIPVLVAEGRQWLGCRVRHQSSHSANTMSLASLRAFF